MMELTVGAVHGKMVWQDKKKKMYHCKCARCKKEDIWSEDEMFSHNILCREQVTPDNLRVLCIDRKETAPGTVVKGKNGTTKCIAYRNSKDVDVLFLENGAIARNKEWKKFLGGGIKNPEGDGWKRIGETKTMNCGMECRITGWRNAHDMDAEFSDGYRLENVSYSTFKAGALNNPNVKRTKEKERIGQKNVNCQGLKMEIIAYASAEDITVRFEDGVIVEHRKYSCFKDGGINHPTYYADTKTGEKNRALNGLMMELIEYRTSNDITIRFEDGEERKASYGEFKKGCVKHPYLWIRKKGVYKGFQTAYQWSEKDKTIYKCQCEKCGYESLLTPQEMIRHEEECRNAEKR